MMTNKEILIDIGTKLDTIGGESVERDWTKWYLSDAHEVKLGPYTIIHKQSMNFSGILHDTDNPENTRCTNNCWRTIGISKDNMEFLRYKYYNGTEDKELITCIPLRAGLDGYDTYEEYIASKTNGIIRWPTHEELPLDEVHMLVTAKYNATVRRQEKAELEQDRIREANKEGTEEYLGRDNSG